MAHQMSRYFCELSMQDYEASGYSVNYMASSCVFLTQVICQEISKDFPLVWNERLQVSSGLLYSDFRHLVKNLCLIVKKQSLPSNYRVMIFSYGIFE